MVDAPVFGLLLAGALLLRLEHLSTPSLWWDEIVQIHSAAGPGWLDVWRAVRDGVPKGHGNAGAVPLDYLLLHTWTRSVPLPDDACAIESYYRTPSLVWSTLAVVVLFLWARRFFDSTIALFASLLLATSIPHVLYAVEARVYSLLTLLTIVSLAAFARLLERRTRGRWLVFTAAGGLLFLGGLPGLFLLGLQYAVLAVVIVHDLVRSARRWSWLALVGSAVAVAALVLAYYADTYWGIRFGRGRSLAILPLGVQALQAYASWSPTLLGIFVASIPLALLYGWRRGGSHLAVTVYLVASLLVLPAILLLARHREYYFHFRHAIFLLPHLLLMTAVGLAFAARGGALQESLGARAFWHKVIGVVLLLALQGPQLRVYLSNPDSFFVRTKTLRDLSGLMQRLRARLDRLAPDQKYLLITERRRPGHLANPSLAKYLDWWGLEDRVLLRGTNDPEQTLGEVARLCSEGCSERDAQYLPLLLRLPSPFGIRSEIQALLQLPPSEHRGPARLGGVGVVYWGREAERDPRPARWEGFDATLLRGLTLFELRGFSPGAG